MHKYVLHRQCTICKYEWKLEAVQSLFSIIVAGSLASLLFQFGRGNHLRHVRCRFLAKLILKFSLKKIHRRYIPEKEILTLEQDEPSRSLGKRICRINISISQSPGAADGFLCKQINSASVELWGINVLIVYGNLFWRDS